MSDQNNLFQNGEENTPTPAPQMNDDVFMGPNSPKVGESNSIDWQDYTVPQAPPVAASYPVPPQGYQIPQGKPPFYTNPSGQQGYPPPPYEYAQQPYYPPQKKKMSTGLKAFIFIASFLFVGTAIGFLLFGITMFSSKVITVNERVTPFIEEQLPPEPVPEPTQAPAPDVQKENPDIQIPPNAAGLTIHERPTGEELAPQEVYQKTLQSTVTITASVALEDGTNKTGVGSGIIITEDGFVLTNSHVVGNTKSSGITVITSDGTEYPAVVVGFDKATDLAVLKTDGKNLIPAEVGNSDELGIGEWVMAIGNPGGSSFSGSITRGVVSGLNRTVGFEGENSMKYIQTDAAINPGNSGGPLVNMYGQVVGINTSKIVADYYEGMGFAIPVTKAKTIIDELLVSGFVKDRVRLGITGRNILPEENMAYNCPTGILIIELSDPSSFSETEAKPGDIITEVDGEAIQDLNMLSGKFLNYKPGDTAKVKLYRMNENGGAGSEFTVTIELLEDKGETQK
ncbi:MAG: trypsin-like peptidase domain-containing protein [Oscillospiraceae bacterium]